MNALPSLHIRSGQGDYPVDFCESIATIAEEIASIPSAVIIADRNVLRLHREALEPALTKHPVYELDATEATKTAEGVLEALGFFQKSNAVKQTVVVAIGGGIVQDIATFAAHVYYRGLRWYYVPTTLLGMADSCIGAKCGINFGPYKNQLGVFHSPAHVWISTRFLETLSDNDMGSGYGEILKLHLTRSGPELYEKLESAVSTGGWRNSELANLIRTSLEVKKGVIEEDEYESDLRRILNYGHTFGHALEAVTHHAVPHGIAVAWGVDLVNFLAWRWGMFARADFERVHRFIAAHFSWSLSQPVPAADLLAASRRDKKVADGKINLILPTRLGALSIVPRAFDAELEAGVCEYLAKWNAIRWP
jgi:3-dehydroquinate synthase